MEYWLKAIEARVPKAAVLLVGMLEDKTKASKDTIQPIIAQLKERYVFRTLYRPSAAHAHSIVHAHAQVHTLRTSTCCFTRNN